MGTTHHGFWAAVSLALALGSASPAAAQHTLKIATLAPEGSSWMKLFHEWDKSVRARTHGRLRLKFQPGGIAGDERDMVRLMRVGRVHGAALSGNGIGLIQPEVRVLELPFLIRTDAELDYVRHKLGDLFRRKLEERGYVLLSWGDAGWIYIFSNQPLPSIKEIRRAKLWAWTDDPIVRALLAVFHIAGVPLGVPDVLPGLTTGQIDCVYGPPLTTLSFGWYRKVKYMLEVPVSIATGGVLVSKAEFDKLPPDEQKALVDAAREMEGKLISMVRADNAQALVQLRKAGIQTVKPAPGALNEFQSESQKVWKQLVGTVYSEDSLSQVKRLLAVFRKGKPAPR